MINSIQSHRVPLFSNQSLNKKHSLSPENLPLRIQSPLKTISVNFMTKTKMKSYQKKFIPLETVTTLFYKSTTMKENSNRKPQSKQVPANPKQFSYQKLKFLNNNDIHNILTESPKNYEKPVPCKQMLTVNPFVEKKHIKSNSTINATTEMSYNTIIPSLSTQSSQCAMPLLVRLKTKTKTKNKKSKAQQCNFMNRYCSMDKLPSCADKDDAKRRNSNNKNYDNSKLRNYLLNEAKSFKKHLNNRLQSVNMLINDLQRVRNENKEELKAYVCHLKAKKTKRNYN